MDAVNSNVTSNVSRVDGDWATASVAGPAVHSEEVSHRERSLGYGCLIFRSVHSPSVGCAVAVTIHPLRASIFARYEAGRPMSPSGFQQ